MSATIDLIGPSTDPTEPQISPEEVNDQVNTALATNFATAAALSAMNLPLIGGIVTGTVHFNDAGVGVPGGQIQANRNITLVAPTANTANKPFFLQNTFTGTNLDSPIGGTAMAATSIINTFNNFNTGCLGLQSFATACFVGPGTMGFTFNGLQATVTQSTVHAPGTVIWKTNTAFSAGVGVTNPNNALSYYTVIGGTSASSGTGPSGQGQAITDGTITWAYQGPGIPANWATSTTYPQGALVINTTNGGLFTCQIGGTSASTGTGPARPRAPLVDCVCASTANIASLSGIVVVDGVTPNVGDRVLVKNQTTQADNGIYVVDLGAWPRADDADTWVELTSAFTTVDSGSTNVGLGFLCTITAGGTLGVTAVTWIQSAAPNRNAITDGTATWALRGAGNQAQQFVGTGLQATCSFNNGGTLPSASIGSMWGAVIGATLTANATGWNSFTVLELDDRMGGSCRSVINLLVARKGKQALFGDRGVVFTAQNFPGYKNGLQFANFVDVDQGYGVSFEGNGRAGLQFMAGCIDTKMVMPTGTAGPFGGNFIYRHFNGQLDGNGAWQLRFGSITPTSTGLAIDVTNVELQSVAVTAGGANWTLGGYWKGTDGSWGQAATIDGSGAILTASVIGKSQVTSPGPATITLNPFNPNNGFGALGDNPVEGSVGPTGDVIWPTAATATPTYVAATTQNIALGSAAVDVIVGNGSAGTTTQTAGFLEIPFWAGPPTGVPANRTKGIAMGFDTTNHKLWCYDNGASAWKGIVLT